MQGTCLRLLGLMLCLSMSAPRSDAQRVRGKQLCRSGERSPLEPLLGGCSSSSRSGLPNSPTGVSAAVEAYVEGNKGIVLLWKFGEVFSLGENT